MVEKGWSVNALNEKYVCPLASLLTGGSADEDVVDFLVSQGARIRPELAAFAALHSQKEMLPMFVRKSIIALEQVMDDVDTFTTYLTSSPQSYPQVIGGYMNVVILYAAAFGIGLSTVQEL